MANPACACSHRSYRCFALLTPPPPPPPACISNSAMILSATSARYLPALWTSTDGPSSLAVMLRHLGLDHHANQIAAACVLLPLLPVRPFH